MTTRKAWAIAAGIAGVLLTSFLIQHKQLDGVGGSALMGLATYFLGRLQTELLPAPKFGRRATDNPPTTPPREDDVPPVAPDLRKEFPPVGGK